MKIISLVTLTTSLLISHTSLAAKSQCGKSKYQNVKYEWCITPTDRTKNPNIMYFMHGMWSSENVWDKNAENKQIKKEWDRLGYTSPTVISITFGRQWLLTEVDGSKKLYNIVMDHIMPELEAKAGGLGKGQRQLMGRSMGGFNSSQLFMKNPRMFDRVALYCPAITTVGPHSSQAEIDAFIKRTGAKKSKLKKVLDWTREEFPTLADWNQHSPVVLAEKDFNKNYPALFISCGAQDEYGFYEGAKYLADLAKERGLETEWAPVKGDHCTLDPIKAAQFFAK